MQVDRTEEGIDEVCNRILFRERGSILDDCEAPLAEPRASAAELVLAASRSLERIRRVGPAYVQALNASASEDEFASAERAAAGPGPMEAVRSLQELKGRGPRPDRPLTAFPVVDAAPSLSSHPLLHGTRDAVLSAADGTPLSVLMQYSVANPAVASLAADLRRMARLRADAPASIPDPPQTNSAAPGAALVATTSAPKEYSVAMIQTDAIKDRRGSSAELPPVASHLPPALQKELQSQMQVLQTLAARQAHQQKEHSTAAASVTACLQEVRMDSELNRRNGDRAALAAKALVEANDHLRLERLRMEEERRQWRRERVQIAHEASMLDRARLAQAHEAAALQAAAAARAAHSNPVARVMQSQPAPNRPGAHTTSLYHHQGHAIIPRQEAVQQVQQVQPPLPPRQVAQPAQPLRTGDQGRAPPIGVAPPDAAGQPSLQSFGGASVVPDHVPQTGAHTFAPQGEDVRKGGDEVIAVGRGGRGRAPRAKPAAVHSAGHGWSGMALPESAPFQGAITPGGGTAAPHTANTAQPAPSPQRAPAAPAVTTHARQFSSVAVGGTPVRAQPAGTQTAAAPADDALWTGTDIAALGPGDFATAERSPPVVGTPVTLVNTQTPGPWSSDSSDALANRAVEAPIFTAPPTEAMSAAADARRSVRHIRSLYGALEDGPEDTGDGVLQAAVRAMVHELVAENIHQAVADAAVPVPVVSGCILELLNLPYDPTTAADFTAARPRDRAGLMRLATCPLASARTQPQQNTDGPTGNSPPRPASSPARHSEDVAAALRDVIAELFSHEKRHPAPDVAHPPPTADPLAKTVAADAERPATATTSPPPTVAMGPSADNPPARPEAVPAAGEEAVRALVPMRWDRQRQLLEGPFEETVAVSSSAPHADIQHRSGALTIRVVLEGSPLSAPAPPPPPLTAIAAPPAPAPLVIRYCADTQTDDAGIPDAAIASLVAETTAAGAPVSPKGPPTALAITEGADEDELAVLPPPPPPAPIPQDESQMLLRTLAEAERLAVCLDEAPRQHHAEDEISLEMSSDSDTSTSRSTSSSRSTSTSSRSHSSSSLSTISTSTSAVSASTRSPPSSIARHRRAYYAHLAAEARARAAMEGDRLHMTRVAGVVRAEAAARQEVVLGEYAALVALFEAHVPRHRTTAAAASRPHANTPQHAGDVPPPASAPQPPSTGPLPAAVLDNGPVAPPVAPAAVGGPAPAPSPLEVRVESWKAALQAPGHEHTPPARPPSPSPVPSPTNTSSLTSCGAHRLLLPSRQQKAAPAAPMPRLRAVAGAGRRLVGSRGNDDSATTATTATTIY